MDIDFKKESIKYCQTKTYDGLAVKSMIALAEDLGLFPSTHIVAQRYP